MHSFFNKSMKKTPKVNAVEDTLPVVCIMLLKIYLNCIECCFVNFCELNRATHLPLIQHVSYNTTVFTVLFRNVYHYFWKSKDAGHLIICSLFCVNYHNFFFSKVRSFLINKETSLLVIYTKQ